MTTTDQKPAAEEKASRADKGKPKPRSPSYPGVNLEEALRLAALVWKADGRNEAHEDNILAHWKYKPKSGLGLVALAALKSFGLLEVNKSNSRLKLSALAISILLDEREDGSERAKAIQVAALNPAMHKAMWEEYGAKLPSDGTVRYFLMHQKKFTEPGAVQFIAEYKATMLFAYPAESGILVHEKSDKLERGTGGAGIVAFKPGDWIQWCSQGSDQFKDPKRVKSVTPDGSFLFVEGEGTGIPTDQVTRVEAPPIPDPKVPPPIDRRQGMNQETITLEGGQFVIQWPSRISKDEYEDLESWLAIMLKRVKKAVQADEPKGQD